MCYAWGDVMPIFPQKKKNQTWQERPSKDLDYWQEERDWQDQQDVYLVMYMSLYTETALGLTET